MNRRQEEFPGIQVALNDNRLPAAQDLVFLAVHPPAIAGLLGEIQPAIRPEAVLVSLAPKVTIARLAAGLGGSQRLVRMIPNAPSFVNAGYNPIAISPALSGADRAAVLELLTALGQCPEVAEEKLEAYAILTGMGPTYLWFQLYELAELGRSFGLTDGEVEQGLAAMVGGAVKTMIDSGLPAAQVMDLIPVKPLGEEEPAIRQAYHSRLEVLYARLKG